MQLPRAFLAVARWCEVITVRQICEFTIKEISGAGNKRSPTKSAQHASASASSNDHSVNGFRRRDSLASRVVFVATSDAGECVVVFQMRFMAGQLGSQASVLDRRRSQTHPVESERSFSRYLILQRRFHAHHNSSAVQTIRTDPIPAPSSGYRSRIEMAGSGKRVRHRQAVQFGGIQRSQGDASDAGMQVQAAPLAKRANLGTDLQRPWE